MSISHVSSISQLDKLLEKPGKLTVIDFHATWCGPCKMIAPVFEKLANQYTAVNFVKVDVDEAQDVAQKYSVSAMPTFVFIKGSDVVHTIRGARGAELTAAVEKYSGSSSASFQGTGHKLGDGKKTSNPVVADPRGAFNLNSEIGTLALIVLGYAALMAYTYYS